MLKIGTLTTRLSGLSGILLLDIFCQINHKVSKMHKIFEVMVRTFLICMHYKIKYVILEFWYSFCEISESTKYTYSSENDQTSYFADITGKSFSQIHLELKVS